MWQQCVLFKSGRAKIRIAVLQQLDDDHDKMVPLEEGLKILDMVSRTDAEVTHAIILNYMFAE